MLACLYCKTPIKGKINSLIFCTGCDAIYYLYNDNQVIALREYKETEMGIIKNEDKPHPLIDRELCTLCGKCIKKCPQKAVSIRDKKLVIDREKCNNCRKCPEICPENALN